MFCPPTSTTALCLHLLRRLQITHVLNAAWGKQRNLGMVNTSSTYYSNANIEFMGVEALDVAVFPLFQHFTTAADFIEKALQQNGKVLVHCGEGISRSSTLVLAYLMIKRNFDVKDAVRTVVAHRNILPNQGFLLQLCQLNDELKNKTYVANRSNMSSANSNRESSASPSFYIGRTPSSSTHHSSASHLATPSKYDGSDRSASPSPYRSSYHSPLSSISRQSPVSTSYSTTASTRPWSSRMRSQSVERDLLYPSASSQYSSLGRSALLSSYLSRPIPVIGSSRY